MSYEELNEALAKLRADISAKARQYQASQEAIDSVIKAMKDPTKNAVKLAEAAVLLKKSIGGVMGPEIYEQIIGQLDEACTRELDQAAFLFGRDLRAAFDTKGVTIKGSAPNFIAEPLIIEADLGKGKVNLKYGQEILNSKPIPLDTERVISAHASAAKALVERKLDANELLDQMFEAYRRVLLQSGGQIGDRVNIVDWYREIVWLRQPASFKRSPSKGSFSEYPRAYFTYDLQQLRRNNLLAHKGHRLQFGTATIDATGNQSRAMWVPEGTEDGRYIMDVYWTREAQ